MSWHRFKTFLKYRLEAKSRHGVHSPFVFDFIEKGLRGNPGQSLEDKIKTYFHDYRLTEISGIDEKNKMNLDALPDTNNTVPVIIFVKNIHLNDTCQKAWEELRTDTRVTLSIDLYNYGLLFFNKEFLVKQHFVLKYPS